MEEEIVEAFSSGDPSVAYEAAMRVVSAYESLASEYAKLRFKVNFGTSVCETCDGLKAGPGVVATCYQLRRCEYSNVREGDTTPKQTRIIDLLTRTPKSS